MTSKYDQLWCERCNRYMLEWWRREDYAEKMCLHKYRHNQKRRDATAKVILNAVWGKLGDRAPPPPPAGDEEFWDA